MADSKKNSYRGQKRKQKGFYVANKRKVRTAEITDDHILLLVEI